MSAILHFTLATGVSHTGADSAGKLIIKAIYGMIASITGIVGLTPIDLGYFLGGLFVVMLAWQIYGAIKGKSSFSLTPIDRETPNEQ